MGAEIVVIRGRFPGAVEGVDLCVRDGRVVSVCSMGSIAPDFGDEDAIIAPGLFDIQVNGAGGLDLQASSLSTDIVASLNDYLNRRGVLRWIPTLVTDSADAMEFKCRILAQALEDRALARHIPGIHLEGPHIAAGDGPRGAHPRAHVRPPNLRLFNRLYRASGGRIRYVTLAPELPGAIPFIRDLVGRGVVVALGHHAAEARHIHAAAEAGARLCTHLGNGMASQIHRHHNGLWPQLADDRLYASVIADLEHLPADTLKVFVRAKGVKRLILTSDSVLLAGMKPGRYHLFGADVEMKTGGRVCLAGTDLLAGSSLLLPQAVMNLHRAAGVTLAQAFAAATRHPARLLGVRLPAWPPRPGHVAEFTVLQQETRPSHGVQLRTVITFSDNQLLVSEQN